VKKFLFYILSQMAVGDNLFTEIDLAYFHWYAAVMRAWVMIGSELGQVKPCEGEMKSQ
jgi:hypothetical protein